MTDDKEGEKPAPSEDTKPAEAKSEPEPEKAATQTQEDPNVATPAAHVGAAWVQPFARFEAWWTKWEARLTAAVLGAEIVALVTWVGLKGMSAEYQPTNATDPEAPVDVSGVIFRAIIGSAGPRNRRALRASTQGHHQAKDRLALPNRRIGGGDPRPRVGALLGKHRRRLFSNALNWLQGASTLTLLGGLRGLATRLTLWLALLGASIATAQGKHINVDVVMRFLTPKMRVPVAVIGWLAAAARVLHRRVGIRRSHRDRRVQARWSDGGRPRGEARARAERHGDFFSCGRQISLDLRTLPKVLIGAKYEDWMKAPEWNEWMNGGDWDRALPVRRREGADDGPGRSDARRASPRSTSRPGGQRARALIRDLELRLPVRALHDRAALPASLAPRPLGHGARRSRRGAR